MPDNDAANAGGSAAPSETKSNKPADGAAPSAPRPARRAAPTYVMSSEKMSLTAIGGGEPVAPGAPPAAPLVPPPPGGAPAPLTPPGSGPAPLTPAGGAAPAAPPVIPPPPGGMAPISAPSASAAPAAPAAPPASSGIPGLSQVGGGGGLSQVGGGSPLGAVGQAPASPQEGGTSMIVPPPPVDPLAALNTQPNAANPYLNSGRPEIENRPIRPDTGGAYVEPGSFDSGKAIMIGAGIVGALVVIWLAMTIITPAVPAPTSFTTYSTATGAFSIDAPDGWAHKSMNTDREDSMTGQKYTSDADGVTFWSGKALVDVSTDSGSASFQDQLLSGQGYVPGTLSDTQHKKFLSQMKKRVGNFQQAADAGLNIPGFGAKITEYTGTTGFLGLGGKVHGYAATIEGPKHLMTISLQAPEKSWDDLKPAYEKMLKSIKLDGVSGADVEQRLRNGFGGMPGPGMGGAGGGGGQINVPGAGSVPMPSGAGGF